MSILFPITEWVTVDQAVNEAHEAGRKLEGPDLRKACRKTFGPAGLAVLITRDGIKTGGQPADYSGDAGGRGVWLVHRSAVEQRLAERQRGAGNPAFRQPGQPGIRRRTKVQVAE